MEFYLKDPRQAGYISVPAPSAWCRVHDSWGHCAEAPCDSSMECLFDDNRMFCRTHGSFACYESPQIDPVPCEMVGVYALDELLDRLWDFYVSVYGVEPPRSILTPSKPYRKKKITAELRLRVYQRDGYQCLKCGARENLSCDHVVPESQGGATEEENLQTMCLPCNIEKGTKTIDYRVRR